MKKTFNYIVFFDLDQTLVPHDSSINLARFAYKKGYLSTANLFFGFFLLFCYKFQLMDTTKILAKLTGWVKGIPVIKVEEMAQELFENVLSPSIFTDACNEIEMHRKNNAEILILSSSMSIICNLFFEKLKLDGIICTHLEIENGALTGKTSGKFCFREEKLVQLKEYCEKNGYNLQKIYFYSDSIADLPALSFVSHPICINPDKRLLKIAQQKKWTIYNWQ